MTKSLPARLAILLPILIGLAAVSAGLSPVGASTKPVTHTPSYGVFYSNSTSDGSSTSPCTTAGCANGISYTWPAGTCYHGDRYPPVAVIWTIKGKVATTEWPLNAPCSKGIEFTWDKHNQLNGAKWLGASSAHEGLSICFQFKGQCNAVHCVTAGCLPAHTTGVDLFFQGGDTPTAAQWFFKGKPASAITISGSPNNVFWYGSTPPTSPFASGIGSTATPAPLDTLTGRKSTSKPQFITDTPPSNANSVHMTWYLPNYESGVRRGCHLVNGKYWTSPPLAFAYTTNGQISSPITVPGCPLDGSSQPMTYNDIQFLWGPTGTGFGFIAAEPWYYEYGNAGCQKSYNAKGGSLTIPPTSYAAGTIPQPPVGANGVIFTYAHDDFKANCWGQNTTVLHPNAKAPGHTRFSVLH